MTTITMTVSSPGVELKNGRGSMAASVTNAGVEPERVVLAAFPGQAATPPAPTYATIPNPLRTIPAGATEQYVVSFDTTEAAPGSYPVRLIAYSADDAPEDYADQAHAFTLVVPGAAEGKKPRKGFPWLWVIIGAVVLLALIGGVVWFLLKDANVPRVEGKPVAEATQLLQDAGFAVATSDKEDPAPAGQVLTQNPTGDTSAARGSTVNLEVAVPVKTSVPKALGFGVEAVKKAVAEAQLNLDFTQGSCNASVSVLQRCVVTGVLPDEGTRVNLNSLVVVKSELRTLPVFSDIDRVPLNVENVCKVVGC